ncbi:MAG: T9SS type A sorting domain-containing protein [Bacteroidales bacterium]|nr:T9SS type A sorting domain-containing protein [Bacteroidales bacterium]
MKKFLLALTAVCLVGSVFAQSDLRMTKQQAATISAKKVIYNGNEDLAIPANFSSMLRTGTFIGSTYYDLQSNGSLSNKLIAWPDGTISAVWTTAGMSATSRGTGYNYKDANGWINGSTSTDRIEPTKTGWSTIAPLGDGEIVAAHNGTSALVIGVRPQKGTGEWSFSTLDGPEAINGNSSSTCLLWPAIATSGNTIHIIACTESDAGYFYQGIQTCLVYIRGTYNASANTISWEAPRIVGNVTSAQFAQFSGDGYSIAANGNNVAVLVADSWNDVILWKSTDNGNTFTTTTVVNSPIADGYNEATTMVLDTPYVSDACCAVALDNNGNAHIAFGLTRVLNDDLGDGSYSYFPGIDGIFYWNETMEPIMETDTDFLDPENLIANGYTVFTRLDLDGDDTAWFMNGGNFPKYGMGMTSTPQLLIDGNDVYMIYTSCLDYPLMDQTSDSYYRGVFATKSSDLGATWNAANATSWLSYNKSCYYINDWSEYTMETAMDYVEIDGESMFPSVAPQIVNGKLTIGWQQDYYAGSEIKDNSVAVAGEPSNIYVMQIAADSIGIYNNTKEIPQGLWIDHTGIADNTLNGMMIYPNPAVNTMNVAISSEESANASLAIYNLMGQIVYSENVALNEGNNIVNVNINNLNAGIYMVNVKTAKGTATQKLIVR